jgi:hypothetical protein
MMALLAAAGGVVVGFGIARSVTYERWVRDRRDLAAIRQRQRINEHFTQTKEVHNVVGRTEGVDGPSGPSA